MSQADDCTHAAGAPVERPVRPRVWMVRRYDAPNYWIPFLHEPVDALKDPEREVVCLHWPEDIAAERERCAELCRRVSCETRNSEDAMAAGRFLENFIRSGQPVDLRA